MHRNPMASSIPTTGLTVVTAPEEPLVDIVFVHGFTGHPVNTWLDKGKSAVDETKDTVSAKKGLGRFAPFSSSSSRPVEKGHVNSTYWPRDLLRGVAPQARVLTYGYDTHLTHRFGPARSQSTLYDIAWDFLVELEAQRRPGGRPLLFIAHSLGGIVVKEALRRSSGCQQGHCALREVSDSTIGIVFFGTPHGGSDPRATVQKIAETVIRAVGVKANEHIVNTLLPSSERLKELRDEFGPIATEREWAIHSFQEQLGVKLLSGRKVVEDVSSSLGLGTLEIVQHISHNHMDMCRFAGPGDVEFQKVAAALQRILGDRTTPASRSQDTAIPAPSVTQEQKNRVINALNFEQMEARLSTIKANHPDTCRWLLQHPVYREWMDDEKLPAHCGIMWIKGKPGAGKSTIMKFAVRSFEKRVSVDLRGVRSLQQMSSTPADSIQYVNMVDGVLSFFFNARGIELEKSTLGLYRSVLLQVLELFPESWSIFNIEDAKFDRQLRQLSCNIEMLQDRITDAVGTLRDRHLILFVDALDECAEAQVRDMILFMERLGEEVAYKTRLTLRICFASRHYPQISLRKGLSLDLGDQAEHGADIEKYIESSLVIADDELFKKVKHELQQKASGVFMWVVLMVRILNKEYDEGLDSNLINRLATIPRDLHSLFMDIVKDGAGDTDHLVLCFQWVLFRRDDRSPNALELYHLIRHDTPPYMLASIGVSTITRFIRNISRGLIEVSEHAPSVRNERLRRNLVENNESPAELTDVRLIHESVRDFLLGGGLASLVDPGAASLQGASHEHLKQCCISLLGTMAGTPLLAKGRSAHSEEAFTKSRPTEASGFYPGLKYAANNIFYHANEAQRHGVDQSHFLRSLDIAALEEIRRIQREQNQFDRGVLPRRLNMMSFDTKTDELRWYATRESHDRLRSYRWMARICIEESHVALFECLWEAQDPESRCLLDDNALASGAARHETPMLESLFKVHLRQLALHDAVPTIVRRCEHCQLNKRWVLLSEDEEYRKIPIEMAELLHYYETLKQHADGRLNVQELVEHALEHHWMTALRLILYCSSKSPSTRSQGKAINWDDLKDLTRMMSLLQALQVSLFYKTEEWATPLMGAVAAASEPFVKLHLCSDDARIDLVNAPKKGKKAEGTALHIAIRHCTPELCTEARVRIVHALLEHGANVEVLDMLEGRSPLSYAAQWATTSMATLLLEYGATSNTTSNDGRSPLFFAIAAERYDMCELLVKAGANVDQSAHDGRTPLAYAAGIARDDICRLLLAFGARADIEDSKGRTPLTQVTRGLRVGSRANHIGTIDTLLTVLHVDSRDLNGKTALHHACCRTRGMHDSYSRGPQYDIVRKLLKEGADPSSKDCEGYDALWYAICPKGRSWDNLGVLLEALKSQKPGEMDKRGCGTGGVLEAYEEALAELRLAQHRYQTESDKVNEAYEDLSRSAREYREDRERTRERSNDMGDDLDPELVYYSDSNCADEVYHDGLTDTSEHWCWSEYYNRTWEEMDSAAEGFRREWYPDRPDHLSGGWSDSEDEILDDGY